MPPEALAKGGGAPGRGRTGMGLLPTDFKSVASTNFATGAFRAGRGRVLPDLPCPVKDYFAAGATAGRLKVTSLPATIHNVPAHAATT